MSNEAEETLRRFEGVALVVRDQQRFIAKLGIGADAYDSLIIARNVGSVAIVSAAATAGAAVASSNTVAGTFFASTSQLAVIGLAPAAVTPIGWVLAAAALTGGACYGALRAFGACRGALVDEVARFINSPIDLLGAAIVDMLGAMAFRVAAADGVICDAERRRIAEHFTEEWGIDTAYAEAALSVIEQNSDKSSLDGQVAAFARLLRKNPDCKLDALRDRVKALLEELVEADGEIAPEETAAIARVLEGLTHPGIGGGLPDLRKTWIGRVIVGASETARGTAAV